MLKHIPENLLAQIDAIADTRKNQILQSETNVVYAGTAYYVAENGCDNNDGLSPDTPWQSIQKVHSFSFQPGDAVFFKRGDTFRGRFHARDGVTYSAYGSGPKPIICASPFNGTVYGEWIPTDVPDIYRYSEKFLDDVGCLIFDDESYAYKATVDFSTMTNLTDCKPFASWRDLANDLDFYHDLGGPNVTGTEEHSDLYLKSTEGNPSKRFKSIEFNVHTNGIMIDGHNIRINNLNIRHAGNHGIGSLTVHGLTVDWCVFEWIGGSMQYYDEKGGPVRFGNAVEIYGGCSDYTVENCYINQVYDAGITHQFSAGGDEDVIMKDIIYKGNLVENCIYSIEYFNGIADVDACRHMSHVRISDNILRYAGCGFGKQRPDHFVECHIKAWDHYNHADNMIYENNIFDRSTHCLLHISCYDDIAYMPIIRKNIFIQSEDGLFARLGLTPTKVTPYTNDVVENEPNVEKNNVYYVL